MNKLEQYVDTIVQAIDKQDKPTIQHIVEVLRFHKLTYTQIFYAVKQKKPDLDLASWDELLDGD